MIEKQHGTDSLRACEKIKIPVAYARGSERKECYRAATVREPVPSLIFSRLLTVAVPSGFYFGFSRNWACREYGWAVEKL